MELKKTNNVNLDKKRTLYFEIGLLVALGLVFAAFEWATPNKTDIEITGSQKTIMDEEFAPNVRQPEPDNTPPPAILTDQIIISDIEPIDNINFIFNDPIDGPPIFIDNGYRPPVEEIDETPSKEFEVDVQAEFMGGGTDKFLKWVMENLKYPEVAAINRIQGKQYVSFVIDKSGKLTGIKVLREIDQSLTEETIRVLNTSPKWKPAIKKGKVVAVQYQMPVNFKLENN